VTILDVGEELDDKRRAIVKYLAGTSPTKWDAQSVRIITENATLGSRSIPKKLVFGSDYLYGDNRSYAPMESSGVDTTPTFARGGYSVAWGASILPAADCDMNGWPITRADLADSYRRVLSDLPLSAATDTLRHEFPLYSEAFGRLKLPRQASELLSDLDRLHASTPNLPLTYGQARLAVRAIDDDRGCGCIYCGMCLSGCVFGAIQNFEQDLQILEKTGKAEYRSGLLVERLEETGDQVRLTCRRLMSGETVEEDFDRVFVAAGALNTTRIMLLSSNLFDTPVRLKDSQKFILPVLRWHRTKVEWPHINTLPAIFIELKVPEVSDHWVHMQISLVNDYVLQRLRVNVEKTSLRTKWLGPVTERLMVAWCGLHSDDSSAVDLRLSTMTVQGRHILKLSCLENPSGKDIVARVSRAIARRGIRFGGIFLSFLRQVAAIGGGNHLGGSFPMCTRPSRVLASDLLGRPAGWNRVHLVDSSVFPTIPGTTVALVIMGNADRIATLAPLD
jgi:choline dehydrogenase-like flavoprotein